MRLIAKQRFDRGPLPPRKSHEVEILWALSFALARFRALLD